MIERMPMRWLPESRVTVPARMGPRTDENLPSMLKNPKYSPLWSGGIRRA